METIFIRLKPKLFKLERVISIRRNCSRAEIEAAGQSDDDLDLEEEDAKHVHYGGGHRNKVPLVLLVNVRLVNQIFNLFSGSVSEPKVTNNVYPHRE